MPRIGKSIKTESGLVVTRNWGKGIEEELPMSTGFILG